ncbi:hypothetical protein MFIFM68171_01653 [Madurella fahalii]|uniref:Secreted protein n=1 Tax=Madurella fahalii TaxID=1157608 RepID=A0ABQ0G109_9PEZI
MRAALRRKCRLSSGSSTVCMTFLSLLRYVSAAVLSSTSRWLRTMRIQTAAFSASGTRRCELSSGISASTLAASRKSSLASCAVATSSRSVAACSTRDEASGVPLAIARRMCWPTSIHTSWFSGLRRAAIRSSRTDRVATTPMGSVKMSSATVIRAVAMGNWGGRDPISARILLSSTAGSGCVRACLRAFLSASGFADDAILEPQR